MKKRGAARVEGDIVSLMTHLCYVQDVITAPRRAGLAQDVISAPRRAAHHG